MCPFLLRLGGFFNWTMTYREDSEVLYPYGWLSNKGKSPPKEPKETWLKPHPTSSRLVAKVKALGHRKPVAWLVSNCHTSSQRSCMWTSYRSMSQSIYLAGVASHSSVQWKGTSVLRRLKSSTNSTSPSRTACARTTPLRSSTGLLPPTWCQWWWAVPTTPRSSLPGRNHTYSNC